MQESADLTKYLFKVFWYFRPIALLGQKKQFAISSIQSYINVLHWTALHCIYICSTVVLFTNMCSSVLHCTDMCSSLLHFTDMCSTVLTLKEWSLSLHYVFRSIVVLHSFRLKLCSGKCIRHCTKMRSTIVHFTYMCSSVLHCTNMCSTVLHSTKMCSTIVHFTDMCSTVSLFTDMGSTVLTAYLPAGG